LRSAFSYVRHFKMGTSSASLSKSDFAEKIVTICGLILCYNSRVKKCKQCKAEFGLQKSLSLAVF
jgi:hypothetical protein